MGPETDARRDAYRRGAEAERLVAASLERDGWTVLARNWRGGGAELDLVVRRDDRLRFVEVKARAEDDPSGLDAITDQKIAKLRDGADAWLAQHGDAAEALFLFAVVTFSSPWTIEWLDDAFDGS